MTPYRLSPHQWPSLLVGSSLMKAISSMYVPSWKTMSLFSVLPSAWRPPGLRVKLEVIQAGGYGGRGASSGILERIFRSVSRPQVQADLP